MNVRHPTGPHVEFLETERLFLRRPTEADIDAIYTAHSDARTVEHNPGDALRSRQDAVDLYRRWDAHWSDHGFGYFTILTREGTIIGFAGVKLATLQGKPVLNLFYRLAPEHWGRRYATEAVTAIVHYVTSSLLGHRLIARVKRDNTASRRILDAVGLVEQPALAQTGEDGFELVYAHE